MKDTLPQFHKKNIARLKELALDCPQCIQDRMMCHHYDYLRRYIEELEALPPFDEQKFDEFWKAYPRKTAKSVALRKWQKLGVDDALFKVIMTALENHKQTKQWAKDKIIPHPATWLNQERWNDELEINGKTPEQKERWQKFREEYYKKYGFYPHEE